MGTSPNGHFDICQNPLTLPFLLFRGQNKQDEAIDCYARAANLFKMAKKWNQVGYTNLIGTGDDQEK